MQKCCPRGLPLQRYEGSNTQKNRYRRAESRKSEFYFSSCATFFLIKIIVIFWKWNSLISVNRPEVQAYYGLHYIHYIHFIYINYFLSYFSFLEAKKITCPVCTFTPIWKESKLFSADILFYISFCLHYVFIVCRHSS
jgi:hypothetical protein